MTRKSLFKSAIRRSLEPFDLKLVRQTEFDEVISELEATRREMETTRRLLTSATHSISKSPKQAPSYPSYSVSQIFISNTNSYPNKNLQHCINSVRRCFSGSIHKIYNDEEIRDFLAKHYDKDICDAYANIKPYAYKADFARLCILAIEGGWYIDIGITWALPMDIPGSIKLFAIRDKTHVCGSSWACSNAIIYARKNHPAILEGILIIMKNYKDKYYGKTPYCPTGPNAWGRALAAKCEPLETLFGDSIDLTPRHPIKNTAFVSESGEIFAFAKPSMGGYGLGIFGEKGTSSYIKDWEDKDVYKRSND